MFEGNGEVGVILTKKQNIEYIKRAMKSFKGDDLERCELAFSHMSSTELDQQYGKSGKTCREIREGYRSERRKWESAMLLLGSL